MSRNLTAIQWLEIVINNKLTSEMGPFFQEAFQIAKQMEKEQIMNAHHAGAMNYCGGEDNFNCFQENDHYYNEVYFVFNS